EPPNYFLCALDGTVVRQLTFYRNPDAQLAGVQRETIHYARADGVALNATLYLPAGYSPAAQGPLPLLLWAYPQDFTSAAAAGQVSTSPYQFDQVGWWSPAIWVSRGYAVLANPSMPVVGEHGREPNDTYVEQIAADARAAVDEVVRRGVAARGRIAV